MRRRTIVIWSSIAVVAVITATTFLLHVRHWKPGLVTLEGAVIRSDEDSRKRLPISAAQVTASDGITSVTARSDASGYFKIRFPAPVWPASALVLRFRHPDYLPLDMSVQTGLRREGKDLYVVAMQPNSPQPDIAADSHSSAVTNIRVRYTENSEAEQNIGSAVKVFQAINKANVPCDGQIPCSSDGKWKAARGSISMDAGLGNEFRNVRASCIAGPCPFTRIDSSGFVQGGRNISVTALDWSDTATFLLESEVFHTAVTSNVSRTYPVIFGRALNFTLPPTQEGVSIEADVDGTSMVFPLGPDLYLSWATCTVRTNAAGEERSKVFRCELKPGFRF